MSKLTGRTAIVTGASKGIGAGIAKRFGAEGASVVVNYNGDRAGADRVVHEILSGGGRAIASQGDVSQAADVTRLFEETVATFGKRHVVVNNAGIARFGAFESMSGADLRRLFDVNVLGTILVCQEAIRRFGDEGGIIINMSSIGSQNTAPSMVAYSATKGAIDTITLGLSREFGARNIRVNSVAPGAIETEGLAEVGFVEGSEMKKYVLGVTPLGRTGTPDDVAQVAVFLASDDAAFLTGERVMVSGGWC
jgi:3-oxoacyl-[acyl-carrier protein] reductase